MHNQRLLSLTLGGFLFFGGNTAVHAEPIYYSFAFAGVTDHAVGGAQDSLFVQDMSCDSGDQNNPTTLRQGLIGEELTVNAFLTAATSAFPAGTADASNTLRFSLTPIGDFTYSTASGNNYINELPQVPEPSSLLLLGSVLTLAVPRLRRWSRR